VTNQAPEEASAIERLVAQGRAAGLRRVEDLRERFGDRPFVDLGLRIYQRDREAAGGVVGAAVAFRLFLFFVPLLLVVVGLAGLLARWIDADEVNQQIGVTGGVAAQINTALSQQETSQWSALIVGLGGVALTGRSLSKVLTTASCLNWRLPVRTRAPIRVIGGVIGVIVGIGLVSTIVNRLRDDLGVAAAGVSYLAVFAVYGLAWMAVSWVLPRATSDPGALLPGSALVGATIAGMQAVSQLYLPDRMGRASQLYGAIGATIVTLGWFFFAGRAIVLGMAINAAVYERFGSISQVVFALPVVRILPRRSAWIRRFFDLSPGQEGVEDPEGGQADEDGGTRRPAPVDGQGGDGHRPQRSDGS
jgi:uncharacterized BrkB/YihY/UPF0761 family membrane protein